MSHRGAPPRRDGPTRLRNSFAAALERGGGRGLLRRLFRSDSARHTRLLLLSWFSPGGEGLLFLLLLAGAGGCCRWGTFSSVEALPGPPRALDLLQLLGLRFLDILELGDRRDTGRRSGPLPAAALGWAPEAPGLFSCPQGEIEARLQVLKDTREKLLGSREVELRRSWEYLVRWGGSGGIVLLHRGAGDTLRSL